ncbi:MOSC domain-containing protein [Actinopolymorpha alba]|uniref:MOSC domain-containing protein n=1 Tax=Actinopolymorpha alba TaxID=533267 RepID=UPI00036EAD85|nr:MOSC N-terminal beta barrel domain-containing protein [Actinopolymorpha alba]
MRVSSLHVYPIKGCRGTDVTQLRAELWGPADDRRWMVVDGTGRFLSQREHPALARVTPRLITGGVEVSADGFGSLAVREPRPTPATLVPVRVWKASFAAVEAGREAHEWFSAYLGAAVRLVWLDDPARRPLNATYGTQAAFADGYPLLVTTDGSLAALNDWLVEAGEEPVPMARFRPNLVVSGAPAWDEDRWAGLRLPGLSLRTTKPCGRCVVTTTDQVTGERQGQQPLAMLARRRRFGKDAVFGMNLAPVAPGIVRVGDPVDASDRMDASPPA